MKIIVKVLGNKTSLLVYENNSLIFETTKEDPDDAVLAVIDEFGWNCQVDDFYDYLGENGIEFIGA